jgi:hypothetical protein
MEALREEKGSERGLEEETSGLHDAQCDGIPIEHTFRPDPARCFP